MGTPLLSVPVASLALVHAGVHAPGFLSGLWHPFTGLDHLLAMVAVGLWSSQRGGRALWILPLVFPLCATLGSALALLGLPLPGVESGVAVSVLVLGLLVLARAGTALGPASLVVALFALFHGHAHGTELPAGASAALWTSGFALSTALLHLLGLGLGHSTRRWSGSVAVRATGALIAAGGLASLCVAWT